MNIEENCGEPKIHTKTKFLSIAIFVFLILCFLSACEGPMGSVGPMGPQGPQGPEGPVVTQLEAPTLLSPGNLTIFNHFPRTTSLLWSSVSGAAIYQLQVDYGWNCSAIDACLNWSGENEYYDRLLEQTFFVFDFVGAQPGRWRVRAIDSNGKLGLWSQYRYFKFTI